MSEGFPFFGRKPSHWRSVWKTERRKAWIFWKWRGYFCSNGCSNCLITRLSSERINMPIAMNNAPCNTGKKQPITPKNRKNQPTPILTIRFMRSRHFFRSNDVKNLMQSLRKRRPRAWQIVKICQVAFEVFYQL